MSLTLKPYPEYKDSGLPWLGKIPAHWEVRGNGRLFAERNQTGFSDLPILEVSLRTGVRIRDLENSNRKQMMSDRGKYKRACQGDIAYNMMRMWQGAVGVAPVDGLISPAYIVAHPFPETKSRFFTYLFRTNVYMDEVDKYSHGIVKDRNRLYWEDFKQIPSPFPPTSEQKSIADFLDAYSRAVGRLIRAKRRLIELLNEQKRGIIHQAVTQGINRDIRLKPSGVKWLAGIPEHWPVKKLKRLTSMKSGDSITALSISENDEYPVYGGNGLRGYASSYTHDGSFVLIGRQGALCGNVHLVSGRFWASEHAVVATLKPGNDIEWFAELLTVMNLNQYSESAAQPGISVGEIQNLYVPVPPPEEQKVIAACILEESRTIDLAISHAEREIKLMREYRTGLIADVVTGKLDVSGVELPALDVAEPSEDLELEEEIEANEMDNIEEVSNDDE